MIYRPVAMFACSLFLATIVSGDYRQPLLAGQIQPESVSQFQDPAMTIITLCWQGSDFLVECQKHSTLLRQLLNRLLYKLKTETRRSNGVMFVNDEQRTEPNRHARKRQEESSSGFYSNW